MSSKAKNQTPRRSPIVYSMPRDLVPWILIHAALFAMGQPGTAASAGAQIGQAELGRTIEGYLGMLASKIGGVSTVWLIYKFLVGAHLAEAVAMTGYCIHRGASPVTTLQWIITHFFVGFPTYFHFQKINPVAK